MKMAKLISLKVYPFILESSSVICNLDVIFFIFMHFFVSPSSFVSSKRTTNYGQRSAAMQQTLYMSIKYVHARKLINLT